MTDLERITSNYADLDKQPLIMQSHINNIALCMCKVLPSLPIKIVPLIIDSDIQNVLSLR